MPTYKLTDLSPEPFTVMDDGKRYAGKMVTQFGVLEYARYQRLSRELQAAMETLDGAPVMGETGQRAPSSAEVEAAAAVVDQVVAEILATIVPDMPDARRRALTLAQRIGLLRAWQSAQPDIDPKGLAPPATKGRRSSG